MKKIFLASLALLLPATILYGKLPSKTNFQKQAENKKNNDLDKERESDLLIIEIFKSKKLTLKDIPQALLNEFEFKRNKLIGELKKFSEQNLDVKTYLAKSKKISMNLFDTFANRLKYIQISEWGQELIAAVKENRSKNRPATNCSSIDVDANKAYLLKNIPKR
jgi:hypothetical protein